MAQGDPACGGSGGDGAAGAAPRPGCGALPGGGIAGRFPGPGPEAVCRWHRCLSHRCPSQLAAGDLSALVFKAKWSALPSPFNSLMTSKRVISVKDSERINPALTGVTASVEDGGTRLCRNQGDFLKSHLCNPRRCGSSFVSPTMSPVGRASQQPHVHGDGGFSRCCNVVLVTFTLNQTSRIFKYTCSIFSSGRGGTAIC